MSLTEQLKLIVAPQEGEGSDASMEQDSQFRDLEEVETVLKEIGVSLEPKFDISLAARAGMVTTTKL